MRLRKPEEKDIPFILEWMLDEDVNRFFRFDPARVSEGTVRAFITEASQPDTADLHLVCVDDVDEYLGTISLKGIDQENKNAEYATSFRKTAQGTGAARFATGEILRKAFGELGLKKVYLNVLAANTRACRFYEKCGFMREGLFRKHLFLRDEWHDLAWYGILREEFTGPENGL